MTTHLERLWVSLLDSPRFRRFSRSAAGRRLFRSGAYGNLLLARNYVASGYAALAHPTAVADVHTFCCFIGHNKSGTSMLGALLDAHPNVILADEVDALNLVSHGFNRRQLFHILLRASRRERLKGRVTGRRIGAYSWLVPGQWQGRSEQLRVVGDSTSGTTTRRFGRDPALLQRLERSMGPVNVRLILVIRNPFDPISIIMVRGKRSFENAIEHYFSNCEIVARLRQELDDTQLTAVRYEQFIHAPADHLTSLCRFLGTEAGADYLAACTRILRPLPDTSRHLVPWTDHWIQIVEDRIQQFDFLQGYTFDS